MGNPRNKKNKITLAAILGLATLAFGIYTYYHDRRPIIDMYPESNNWMIDDLSFFDGEDELIFYATNIGKDRSHVTLTITAQGAQIRSDTSEFSNTASYGYTLVYDTTPSPQRMPFFIKINPDVERITLKVDGYADGLTTELRYRFDKNLLVFDKAKEPFMPNTFHYNRTTSSWIS